MASNNNNTLNPTVTIFAGANFRAWQQSMGDYLKSQKLWHHATGIVTHPVAATPAAPMPAELQLQGTWDETDDQIKGILGVRLSPNLRTHLGTTAAPAMASQAWISLETTFGQPGISAIFADYHVLHVVKISGQQNLQVEIQWMNTILERLTANGVTFSDPIRGMQLLAVLPQKWDNVSMVYPQGKTQLTQVTFVGVRDTIMAEFERTTCPSALVANKLSAVKRKGTSPTFTQQTQPHSNNKGKFKASGEPSGAPQKKNRCGGKGKGKNWAHEIVSSALIPHDVIKRLQESHYVAVEPPAPAPRPYSSGTIIGGPSRAPAGASCQIVSFNSSRMTTCLIEPLTGHSFSGWSGIRGPNSLTKVEWEQEFPPLVPVQVPQPVTPIVARATIVDNVVVSLSCLTLEDLPATAPLAECISSPIIEERVQTEQHPKNRKIRTRRGKKAKKEAVHPAPIVTISYLHVLSILFLSYLVTT